jgi:hypothetical protein
MSGVNYSIIQQNPYKEVIRIASFLSSEARKLAVRFENVPAAFASPASILDHRS